MDIRWGGVSCGAVDGARFVPKQTEWYLWPRYENGLLLEGVTLHLSAGDEAAAVRTNRFGWAQASVTVPEGSAPIAAVSIQSTCSGKWFCFEVWAK